MKKLTEDHLEKIFDAFVKSGYEPHSDLFDIFSSITKDELRPKGVRNRYEDILEYFLKNGTTSSDPTVPPLMG